MKPGCNLDQIIIAFLRVYETNVEMPCSNVMYFSSKVSSSFKVYCCIVVLLDTVHGKPSGTEGNKSYAIIKKHHLLTQLKIEPHMAFNT